MSKKIYIDKNELNYWYTDQKLSSREMSLKFGISKTTVLKLLKDFNICKRKTNGTYSNYKVDENYFKVWKPEMAYMLGYIAADGYVSLNGRLDLVSIDLELIDFCKRELNTDAPIRIRYPETDSPQYTLGISSKTLVSTLNELGVHNKKSLNIDFPDYISDDYIWHYLRGYTDGDGCVYKVYNISCIGMNLLGSKSFMTNLKSTLENKLKIVLAEIRHKKGIYSLDFRGNAAYVLLKLMYENNHYGLSRKKERAICAIKAIEDKRKKTIYCQDCILKDTLHDLSCPDCKKMRKHAYYIKKAYKICV